MFQLVKRRLDQIAKEIEDVFVNLDKQVTRATASASNLIDIYSKANESIAAKVEKIYVTLEICSTICSHYLQDCGFVILDLKEIPNEHRKILEEKITPDWKSFQHSVNSTLKKYSKYLDKLDKDNVEELHAIIEMSTGDVLKIFDSMLKEDPDKMNTEDDNE